MLGGLVRRRGGLGVAGTASNKCLTFITNDPKSESIAAADPLVDLAFDGVALSVRERDFPVWNKRKTFIDVKLTEPSASEREEVGVEVAFFATFLPDRDQLQAFRSMRSVR